MINTQNVRYERKGEGEGERERDGDVIYSVYTYNDIHYCLETKPTMYFGVVQHKKECMS